MSKDEKQMSEVVISVVVPVYKVEKYIAKCIGSIRNQTFRDWELILVDDGSPDGSGAICDRYAAEDERIRVIHTENAGVSEARNRGIEEAHGRWITFIDSDDWVEPEYLADFMRHEPVDGSIVVSGLISDDPQHSYVAFGYADERSSAMTPAANLIVRYDLFADGGPVNKLFDLGLIKRAGLKFRSDLRYHEDHTFVYAYYLQADTIILSKFNGYHYMHYGEASSASLSNAGKKAVEGLLKASDVFLEQAPRLFEHFDITDPDYRRKVLTRTGYSQRVLAIYNLYLHSERPSAECRAILSAEHSALRRIARAYWRPTPKRRLFILLISLPTSLTHASIRLFSRLLNKNGN